MPTPQPLPATAALAGLLLASCTPPPPIPPPIYTQYPAYPPTGVAPYTPPADRSADPPTYQPLTDTPPQPDTPPPSPGEYPTAQRTANPNQVISPYPPHNVIDVEGFTSGQLARDPSNRQIFRVP